MDRMKEIEAKIAELEEVLEAEEKRDYRVLDEVRGVYEGQEKTGLSALRPLLDKSRLAAEEIEEFYSAQEKEARRRVETATPQLQLNKDELDLIERGSRAVLLINPCAMVRSTSICQFHAAACNSSHWETSNASGSCVCNTSNNEWNPKVETYGQGVKGVRLAQVRSRCYFHIGARPNPAMVHIDTLVDVHGFYVLQAGVAGSALVTLDLEARGFQYGWSWGSALDSVLSLSGDTMGRYDGMRHLHFEMPAGGGDPLLVRVMAKLTAWAKRGGALAVGDFATGAGNRIRTIYVNTYSDP